MALAGRELASVSANEFPAAVAAYRREHLDTAALDIREQLDELGAVPTLLRALGEKWAVPTVASMAIATAMLDASTAAAAVGSTTGLALTAREALARRAVRLKVRQQPYWYLQSVDRTLAKR